LLQRSPKSDTGGMRMSSKVWQFVEVPGEGWCWQRGDPDDPVTSKNSFPDLASCIFNAEENGFRPAKPERRRRPRNQPGCEMRCVGGA